VLNASLSDIEKTQYSFGLGILFEYANEKRNGSSH
jgi:hypothetical protein